jgi:hypothetical protein
MQQTSGGLSLNIFNYECIAENVDCYLSLFMGI